MTNSVGRRDFKAEEYQLYDVKKARPFWNKVCEIADWQIIKNIEDFGEDFVCKIIDETYIMELQVVGYWHNFNKKHISNLWISASKVNNLREKAKEKNTKAGLIFLNCVPDRFIGIDIDYVSDEFEVIKPSEKSYKIPYKTLDHYVYKELLSRNFCDCLENHLEIMQQSNGRIPMAEKKYNIRGKNGICCR
jgi:hypothetical protein|tara:strand:- start:1447 stop:2019 length:573 start_codon:yes stop_codon:yes gene_type:complete